MASGKAAAPRIILTSEYNNCLISWLSFKVFLTLLTASTFASIATSSDAILEDNLRKTVNQDFQCPTQKSKFTPSYLKDHEPRRKAYQNLIRWKQANTRHSVITSRRGIRNVNTKFSLSAKEVGIRDKHLFDAM